ncbi:surface-adhesin E family protein [Iodobacter fluviatilis]|uniref:surface-adhesin E family protein n=1 Tax=Iodobacter fluviatilis TaxID=537 RepID=UPI00104291B5|nr:surface-adhesin E family protein [Iodobacter fluviatilis]
MKFFFVLTFIYIISSHAVASEVMLDLNVIGNSQKLTLRLKSNLPRKTRLVAALVSPVNQGGNGYFGQNESVVSTNQTAEFGPFLKNKTPLPPGNYLATVTTLLAALQPEEAQSFFGKNGENLSGSQVSTLAGTSEKGVTQTLRFQINSDGSISTSPSDEHVIGSSDDVWQKVQSSGKEIYVKTNGFFYDKEHYSGVGFHSYIVANLPESNIIGAPQSVMNDVEGNCETRTFHVLGTLFFAGKNRSGVALNSMPPENIERNLVVNSPFEKAFNLLCKMARLKK